MSEQVEGGAVAAPPRSSFFRPVLSIGIRKPRPPPPRTLTFPLESLRLSSDASSPRATRLELVVEPDRVLVRRVGEPLVVAWHARELVAIVLAVDTPKPRTASTVRLLLRHAPTKQSAALVFNLEKGKGFSTYDLELVKNRLKVWSRKYLIRNQISDTCAIEAEPLDPADATVSSGPLGTEQDSDTPLAVVASSSTRPVLLNGAVGDRMNLSKITAGTDEGIGRDEPPRTARRAETPENYDRGKSATWVTYPTRPTRPRPTSVSTSTSGTGPSTARTAEDRRAKKGSKGKGRDKENGAIKGAEGIRGKKSISIRVTNSLRDDLAIDSDPHGSDDDYVDEGAQAKRKGKDKVKSNGALSRASNGPLNPSVGVVRVYGSRKGKGKAVDRDRNRDEAVSDASTLTDAFSDPDSGSEVVSVARLKEVTKTSKLKAAKRSGMAKPATTGTSKEKKQPTARKRARPEREHSPVYSKTGRVKRRATIDARVSYKEDERALAFETDDDGPGLSSASSAPVPRKRQRTHSPASSASPAAAFPPSQPVATLPPTAALALQTIEDKLNQLEKAFQGIHPRIDAIAAIVYSPSALASTSSSLATGSASHSVPSTSTDAVLPASTASRISAIPPAPPAWSRQGPASSRPSGAGAASDLDFLRSSYSEMYGCVVRLAHEVKAVRGIQGVTPSEGGGRDRDAAEHGEHGRAEADGETDERRVVRDRGDDADWVQRAEVDAVNGTLAMLATRLGGLEQLVEAHRRALAEDRPASIGVDEARFVELEAKVQELAKDTHDKIVSQRSELERAGRERMELEQALRQAEETLCRIEDEREAEQGRIRRLEEQVTRLVEMECRRAEREDEARRAQAAAAPRVESYSASQRRAGGSSIAGGGGPPIASMSSGSPVQVQAGPQPQLHQPMSQLSPDRSPEFEFLPPLPNAAPPSKRSRRLPKPRVSQDYVDSGSVPLDRRYLLPASPSRATRKAQSTAPVASAQGPPPRRSRTQSQQQVEPQSLFPSLSTPAPENANASASGSASAPSSRRSTRRSQSLGGFGASAPVPLQLEPLANSVPAPHSLVGVVAEPPPGATFSTTMAERLRSASPAKETKTVSHVEVAERSILPPDDNPDDTEHDDPERLGPTAEEEETFERLDALVSRAARGVEGQGDGLSETDRKMWDVLKSTRDLLRL